MASFFPVTIVQFRLAARREREKKKRGGEVGGPQRGRERRREKRRRKEEALNHSTKGGERGRGPTLAAAAATSLFRYSFARDLALLTANFRKP